MTDLTANQKSFIRLMTRDDEHARHGFGLLLKLKGDDLDRFFDALLADGLFAPGNNPAPVPVDADSVRIPYWAALDYLAAVANLASNRQDLDLAEKVMKVVRVVSTFQEPDGSIRDNYHTFRKFAEILGSLPSPAVTIADVNLAPTWLSSRFDNDGVARALDEGAIKKFLDSGAPEDWSKATQLLRHCTVVRWDADAQRGTTEKRPVPVVNEYWLKKLISHNAIEFGGKGRREAAEVLRERVREVFGQGGRAERSHMYRPAVEDHAQNYSAGGPDNSLVEGLRDVLAGWCDQDPDGATEFVGCLLRSDIEMLRRIGIYVLNRRWSTMRRHYLSIVSSQFFTSGHLHELWGLLREHFDDFNEDEKAATIRAIRLLPLPGGDDPDSMLRHIQWRWLLAVSGTTYVGAASWLKELESDPKVGGQLEHPDFLVYVGSSWGPGPSPYQVQELVAFAEQKTIVERVNAFKPTDTLRGLTIEALVEALEQAVAAAPLIFLDALPTFVNAGPRYQAGLIAGFRRLWDDKDGPRGFDWDQAWARLVEFFELLAANADFWTDDNDQEGGGRGWTISVIPGLLQAGTRDDGHAYPEALLPRTWILLQVLLEHAKPADHANDDPMAQAINTPKGKAIEAVFSHALRVCRISDAQSGSHADAWNQMKPVFENELKQCETGNYEFSTLAGAYIANLGYMDEEWVGAHMKQVFPADHAVNFGCAMAGLAYSAPTRPVYVMLRDAGILDVALRQDLKGRDTREKLIERIALGYLWGEEELASSRFLCLFDSGSTQDLEHASWLFARVHAETLSAAQASRIGDYWQRCVSWAETLPQSPRSLLSSLSRLATYLQNAAGKNRDLLLAVAPHVHIGLNTHEFAKELLRLAESSPVEVSEVFDKVIETYDQSYDYENRLKSLVARLAELGQRSAALDFCNRLRNVPGMDQLFEKLQVS